MMNCQEARDLMLETLTGTTVPDVRRLVEAHLADCPACRQEAAALEETALLLRTAPEPALHDDHWDTFMVRLQARIETERRAPWARVLRWLQQPRHVWTTAAATTALVIGLGMALLVQPGAPPTTVDLPSGQLAGFVSPQVVRAMPAMTTSLSVWKSGLGSRDVPYDLGEGE